MLFVLFVSVVDVVCGYWLSYIFHIVVAFYYLILLILIIVEDLLFLA